jgi:5-methylcytosine-specific restriction endonuclease McrA
MSKAIAEAKQRRRTVCDTHCRYCGVKTTKAFGLTQGTVDHLKPVALGGSDGPENLVWACSRCNFEKGKLYRLVDLLRVVRNVLLSRLIVAYRTFRA